MNSENRRSRKQETKKRKEKKKDDFRKFEEIQKRIAR